MHGDLKPENILLTETLQASTKVKTICLVLTAFRFEWRILPPQGFSTVLAPQSRNRNREAHPVICHQKHSMTDAWGLKVTSMHLALLPGRFSANKKVCVRVCFCVLCSTSSVFTFTSTAWQGLKVGRIMMAAVDGTRPPVDIFPMQIGQFLATCWAGEPDERCVIKSISLIYSISLTPLALRLSSDSLRTHSVRLALLAHLENALKLQPNNAKLHLLDLQDDEDPTATIGERCVLLTVRAITEQVCSFHTIILIVIPKLNMMLG